MNPIAVPSTRVRYLSVIGPSQKLCTPEIYAFGEWLGQCLADKGYGIVCGGTLGLMEAVCKGAKAATQTFQGATIGIIPGDDARDANAYCDIVIPTGMGFARNVLVVKTGAAAIAVGGGAGTLSEISYAWQFGKPICAVQGLGGFSEELAGRVLDNRFDQPIAIARSVEDVLHWVDGLW
jgi:uncharacterized protein (TIGR00725 family)